MSLYLSETFVAKFTGKHNNLYTPMHLQALIKAEQENVRLLNKRNRCHTKKYTTLHYN